eukprot:5040528-Prymnesium_polylepis.2
MHLQLGDARLRRKQNTLTAVYDTPHELAQAPPTVAPATAATNARELGEGRSVSTRPPHFSSCLFTARAPANGNARSRPQRGPPVQLYGLMSEKTDHRGYCSMRT